MRYIRKRKVNHKANRLFFFMVFSVILIYVCGYVITFLMKPKLNTVMIQASNLDNENMYTGLIIRNEKLYRASKTGSVIRNLNNNDIAKRSVAVCVIQDKKTVSELQSNLESVNNEIISTQKKRSNISLFKTDVENADKTIKSLVDNNLSYIADLDMDKINNLQSNIKQNIDLRNQILLTENRGSIKDMDSKRSNLEHQILNNTAVMKIDNPGIISYRLDGFEDKFKDTNVPYEKIIIKPQTFEVSDNAQVKRDDIVFKAIESPEWHIVAYVDKSEVKNWEVGSLKTIYVEHENSYIPLEILIEHMESKSGNRNYVLLKATKYILQFIDVRNIKFKLHDEDKIGLKIPSSAVQNKLLIKIPNEFVNDNSVMKKFSSGEIKNIKLNVLESDNKFCYASSPDLSISDFVIAQDKTFQLKDVKKVKGIYLANTGVAQFKKVNVESESGDYVFISPSSEIREYDRVVINAQNITDAQKITG